MSPHSSSKLGRVAAALVLAVAALVLLAGEALLAGDTPFDPLAALQNGKPTSVRAEDQTYEVVSGDCLWAIAERFMGDGSRWTEIFDANSDQISNPNLIYPGQKFKIPGGTGGGTGGGPKPGKASVGGRDAQGRNAAFQKLPVAHGHISSRFGPRPSPCAGCSSYHQGLDIGAGRGTPVYATGAGRVVFVGSSYGGGNTITIDHGNGYQTQYLHLQHGSFRVREGDQVSAGQQIAGVNSTGQYTTGDHLHFAVKHNGQLIDPERMLDVPNSF